MIRGLVLLLALTASSSPAEELFPLWPGEPPLSKPNTLEEHIADCWGGVRCAYDITRPTLTVHPPRGTTASPAVVVVPGGGYEVESIFAEGREIAQYLAARGVTAAVLKYRLPLAEASDEPHRLPLADARRALGLMRSLADRYGFDAAKVGILGFSAGGHLAAAASVLPADRSGELPDFAVLAYPVTTLGAANREWLEKTLFHRPMTEAEQRLWSLVDQVSATTPPTFLVHAYDDDLVPVTESLRYAQALRAAGRPVETHVFATGGHGFGSGRPEDGTDQWLDLVTNWLRRR